jgi:hypothetical protein
MLFVNMMRINVSNNLNTLFTLFIIGLGFICVIPGEPYLGYLCWPYARGVGRLSLL